MILIDVHVPVLDQAYDFELDEDLEVGMLMEEILDLLSNKEQYNTHLFYHKRIRSS